MSVIDYLIVGQGLAGSILADKLMERGRSIVVVDDGNLSSSSIIAAGIINPITGRRFVKSWMYDELATSASDYYQGRFGKKNVFRPMPIYRILKTAGEENDYLSRSGQDGWAKYMDFSPKTTIDGIQSTGISMGIIRHAATIHINAILDIVKSNLCDNKLFHKDKFNYNTLDHSDKIWTYQNIKAKNIIFCEGSNINQNPFFNYLPMVPAKGELLIIRSNQLPNNKMIKGELIIVPLIHDLFWVGATYAWDFDHDLPTETNYINLTDRLNRMLDHPYEIVQQSSAIRPTVKDRRPLLGCHSDYSNMYIFNGFGTKGASLIPYFADHLISFLEERSTLLPEVNTKRFSLSN